MPASTLSERTIANLAALHRPRVVVISLRKEIAAALAEGLTLSEIWKQLHAEGAFRVGYDRFRRLVRQHVTQPSASRRARPRAAGKGASAPASPAASGFAYSPTPKPDDLF